ncbi:Mannan endo-1,4-beta-mannosidase [Vigna angularis]|uniref:mannan endo-1,4-beta-mannosidase n=1 Tax=Phaseolus angularis TaxID=3914 RepID=A0A8T0L2T3_PHAAN|nr:Mannan endo-1,4-beta-mannosidase [Vigna angularis]
MNWEGGLKSMVLMVAFMVAMVAVQNVGCEEGVDHVRDSARNLVQNGGFVRRSGTNFVLNNKRFYFNGFNAYWLMLMASDPSTRPKVTSVLQQASSHGLTVARTWAFNDGAYRALQVSPGSYDEKVFRGLDFVISEAGKNGVRLILSLVNNWKDFGGKNQYVEWVKQHGEYVNTEDDFFTHPLAKQHFKNHIKAVLTRKNTVSGVAYKDDPAIFAWELMNEPRSQHDNSGKVIQEWVIEMAGYVKSIDSNHLLEIGLEGFYGEDRKQINPGLPGSNEAAQVAFVDKWLQTHIEDSKNVLGKPIVVGEFGKSCRSYSVAERDSYLSKMYNAIYSNAISGGPCAGGLFWQLMAQGMDSFYDGYEVVFQNSPSTTRIIDQQSHKMSSIA